MKRSVLNFSPVLLIALSFPAAQAAVRSVPTMTPAAASARTTLEDLRYHAQAVATQADELKTLIPNALSDPRSQADRLMAMKADINSMGREVEMLQSERPNLEQWQQHALDKVLPLLQSVASSTENSIEYFNDNKNHLWAPSNLERTDRIYQDSEHAARILRAFLKDQELRGEESRVESEIGSGL
jgi:hypothetical protein